MNLLVVIGTTAAYLYSVSVLFFPYIFPEEMRNLYFEGAAAVITFVLLGRFLEIKSKNKASDFMKKLLSLKPEKAVIVVDGKEIEVKPENIVKGDTVLVKPGEKIPVDGIIIEGEGEIDQSSITGEPLPVFKKKGDKVISGTVNINGFLKIKAITSGKNSTLFQILKLMEQAQSKKPPVGKLADKIVSIFVPAVLIISITVFDVWFLLFDNIQYGFLAAVSVLIIACPCALGLATPISIVVAIGKGANEGILIKNPEVLEVLKKIDVAVFDKTGTITEGKPYVVEKHIFNENLLKYAIPVLSRSSHILSKAVLEVLKGIKTSLKVDSFTQISGKGIRALVEGKEVLIGSKEFLEENGISIDKNFSKTAVVIAVNKTLVGYFLLEDKIKKDTKELIKYLKEKGIKTYLFTGDREEIGNKVGKETGFDIIKTGMLPEEKYKEVLALQKAGHRVLFVGDGINDALSIKVADVGIAVWQSTDLTKEAGDILLMKKELSLIKKAIKLSEKTVETIKYNLAWAYIYNILGIPVAGGILYPFLGILLKPVYAGMAMSLSSVSVVLNALRLKYIKL